MYVYYVSGQMCYLVILQITHQSIWTAGLTQLICMRSWIGFIQVHLS